MSEAALLRDLASDLLLDVQHVGSTAVPGLAAKPILDIVGAVRSLEDIRAVVAVLVAHGYIDRGDGGREGGHLLVRESAPEVRTVHLHLVEQPDPQWGDYLAFREALRRDAALCRQYEALKRDLAARFADDRQAYTQAKCDFIEGVLRSQRCRE